MDKFIGEGRLPNFKKLRDESMVFVSEAAETSPHLDPWIQWVTVHTGLDHKDHGVLQLDEGHLLDRDRVWDLVSAIGKPVWVCGSMSTRYRKPLNGYLMPDPWTTKVTPYPAELNPFFDFVRRNVQEYTRDRVPLSTSDYVSFVRFLVGHGLSMATATATVQQLLREKTKGQRWKRAVILDKLQADVFLNVFRKIRPAFSTFFLNSTAHFQHIYWRNMEPEQFDIKASDEENVAYGDAILYGYQEMDRLLRRFTEAAGSDVTIVLATAMSQQPCAIYEEQGGKKVYRPLDYGPVLEFAGISRATQVSAVMSNQFHIFFETEQEANVAQEQLDALRVLDQPVLCTVREGNRLLTGAQFFGDPAQDTPIEIEGTDKKTVFFDLFYKVEGIKSGMHHPDGIFWIRTPQRHHFVAEAKVPLRTVAPTVLDLLRIGKPDYMTGESVLARMSSVV